MADPISIGALAAGLTSLIAAIFSHIRNSRCTHIECCGCLIDRELVD